MPRARKPVWEPGHDGAARPGPWRAERQGRAWRKHGHAARRSRWIAFMPPDRGPGGPEGIFPFPPGPVAGPAFFSVPPCLLGAMRGRVQALCHGHAPRWRTGPKTMTPRRHGGTEKQAPARGDGAVAARVVRRYCHSSREATFPSPCLRACLVCRGPLARCDAEMSYPCASVCICGSNFLLPCPNGLSVLSKKNETTDAHGCTRIRKHRDIHQGPEVKQALRVSVVYSLDLARSPDPALRISKHPGISPQRHKDTKKRAPARGDGAVTVHTVRQYCHSSREATFPSSCLCVFVVYLLHLAWSRPHDRTFRTAKRPGISPRRHGGTERNAAPTHGTVRWPWAGRNRVAFPDGPVSPAILHPRTLMEPIP